MKVNSTSLEGCYVIDIHLLEDNRGWFSRVFCKETLKPLLGDLDISQINHSFNKVKGTFRGMHYQNPPFSEDKLIRCIAGSIVDFVLDIREDSPTFLKWIAVELSAENRKMIFIPKGMAHGFQTTQDNTELIYHHTEPHNKNADVGLRFDDPLINIRLPLEISMISEKDRNYQLINTNFKGVKI